MGNEGNIIDTEVRSYKIKNSQELQNFNKAIAIYKKVQYKIPLIINGKSSVSTEIADVFIDNMYFYIVLMASPEQSNFIKNNTFNGKVQIDSTTFKFVSIELHSTASTAGIFRTADYDEIKIIMQNS